MTRLAGAIANDASLVRVELEKTPTVDGPSGTANLEPSGANASGVDGGASEAQHGDAGPNRERVPNCRTPARSHSSRRPSREDVYKVDPSGLIAAPATCPGGPARTWSGRPVRGSHTVTVSSSPTVIAARLSDV